MREQLERRLEALKNEFTAGRTKAAELEQQQTTLHQTLLRISGAIQVLEEELKAEGQVIAPKNEMTGDAAQTAMSGVNGALDHVST